MSCFLDLVYLWETHISPFSHMLFQEMYWHVCKDWFGLGFFLMKNRYSGLNQPPHFSYACTEVGNEIIHSFSHCNTVAAASQLPVNGAEKSWVHVPPTGTKLRNHVLLLTDPILTYNWVWYSGSGNCQKHIVSPKKKILFKFNFP